MILPLRPVVAALALGTIVLVFAAAVLTVGPWLVVSDPLPTRLDVIFTFAGDNQRLHYSRNLMEKYPTARWVLSDYHGYYSRILVRGGFDMARVSPVDSAANTLSEVRALAAWLRSGGMRADSLPRSASRVPDSAVIAVGLVSSPYHMRRISFMMRDVFRNDAYALRFYYLPVPLEKYRWKTADLRTWWRSPLRSHVISEIGKLLVYWLFP